MKNWVKSEMLIWPLLIVIQILSGATVESHMQMNEVKILTDFFMFIRKLV